MDYLYGCKSLSFGGVEMGQIGEDGITIGGDAPTKNKIYSAQKRTGPVKVLESNPGSTTFTFVLIELNAKNLAQVLGGEVDKDGAYRAPTSKTQLEGEFEISLFSGETIKVRKALLTASWANAINMSNVLGVQCELEVMEPGDGSEPYMIVPAA